jgi:hypothetical protein
LGKRKELLKLPKENFALIQSNMLSITECKTILEESGEKYTDEEVEQMRDMLWRLARLNIESFKESLKKETGNDKDLNIEKT